MKRVAPKLLLLLGAILVLTGARKPAIDQAAVKKDLAAVVASFQKLEKDLAQRKAAFASGMRRPGFDPQEAIRLDRQYQAAQKTAGQLADKHARIVVRGGKRNATPPPWARKIDRLHEAWIKQALAAGESPKSGKPAHLPALRLMQAVMGRTQDEAALAAFRPRLARLFQLSGQHADAVRAFLQLADADSGRRLAYLKGAAVSQAALAGWPASPPWVEVAAGKNPGGGSPASRASARTELKDLHTRIATEQGGQDNSANWVLEAHNGLIDWISGQQAAAVELWRPRLNSQATLGGALAVHRSQAGGFTLHWYRQNKSWAELEKTARQAMSQKWRPAYGKQNMDPVGLLGDALFEGGKALLASGDAASAENKLGEFTANFRKDRRFEEALFLRGKAERGARNFIDALGTFKEFTAQFPRSKFDEEANRLGFELATDMADEESGLAFGKRYMNAHGNKPAAGVITSAYASLAMGKGFYREGADAMERLARKEGSRDARIDALTRLMDLQNLVGRTGDVLVTANKLQKLGQLSPEVRLRIARAQARAAAAANNSGLIARARNDAANAYSAIGEGDQPARDAYGEVLFIAAEVKGRGEVDEVFSLEVRNPEAHLGIQEAKYNQAKSAYDAVCAAGRNVWCAPALYRTARLADRFRAATGELGIAETLAAEVVESFQRKKEALINRWTQEAKSADAQAAELANQGMATPSHALTIQLGAGADLILDDRTISGIHGYTQLDAR